MKDYPSTLIITHSGNEKGLFTKIAGLSWIERIFHLARLSDIENVVLCHSDHISEEILKIQKKIPIKILSAPAQLAAFSTGRLLIVNPSVLVDITFMKQLCAMPDQGNAVMPAESLDILAVNGNIPASSLPDFFKKNSMIKVREDIKRDFECRVKSVENGSLWALPENNDVRTIEKEIYKQSIKHTGGLTGYLNRWLSSLLVRKITPKTITPNQITFFAIILGFSGACLLSFGWFLSHTAGALLIFAHSALDGCDGAVARIKFNESRLGSFLDFWGDNLVLIAGLTAIGSAWFNKTPSILPVALTIVAVTGTLLSSLFLYYQRVKDKVKTSPIKLRFFFSRRDAIYILLILAFSGHIEWFLIMASLLAPLFFIFLMIKLRKQPKFN